MMAAVSIFDVLFDESIDFISVLSIKWIRMDLGSGHRIASAIGPH